jgi:DNA ligase (NAD+)
VERGLVREPLDLFNLTIEQLGKLNLGTDEEPRIFGEKNATKVIEALERAKQAPLHRWIHALAIPEIGETTARQLAQVHGSLPALADSAVLRDIRELGDKENERAEISPRSRKNPPKNDEEKAARQKRHEELAAEIEAVKTRLDASGTKSALAEVGPIASASVLNFFASEDGKRILRRLHDLGINPTADVTVAGDSNSEKPLNGKTFVLTGTLPTLSRDEASALIREAGGNVTGSVSKNTSFLLAGESAGSKMDKARELGIEILNEEQFRALLKESSGAETAGQRSLL